MTWVITGNMAVLLEKQIFPSRQAHNFSDLKTPKLYPQISSIELKAPRLNQH